MKRYIAAAILPLSITAPAHADNSFVDVRPCATNTEIFTTPSGLSRKQLEKRWEVTGLGVRGYVPILDTILWTYPACKPYSEDIKFAFAGFDKDGSYVVGFYKHDG